MTIKQYALYCGASLVSDFMVWITYHKLGVAYVGLGIMVMCVLVAMIPTGGRRDEN